MSFSLYLVNNAPYCVVQKISFRVFSSKEQCF